VVQQSHSSSEPQQQRHRRSHTLNPLHTHPNQTLHSDIERARVYGGADGGALHKQYPDMAGYAAVQPTNAGPTVMEGTPQFGGQNYSSTHATQQWGIKDVPTPKRLVLQLDQWVIGQGAAKKTLAVAVYNHFKRLQNKRQHTQRTQQAGMPPPGGGAAPNLLVRRFRWSAWLQLVWKGGDGGCRFLKLVGQRRFCPAPNPTNPHPQPRRNHPPPITYDNQESPMGRMSMLDGTPIDRSMGAAAAPHMAGSSTHPAAGGLASQLGGAGAAGTKGDEYQEVEKSNVVMLVRGGPGFTVGG